MKSEKKQGYLVLERSQVGVKSKSKTDIWIDTLRKNWQYYLMAFPFIAWYILFEYKPLTGLVIAFKDYNLFKGIAASPWVGFENFVNYFTNPYFWSTIRNTLMLSLYNLTFGFPLAIIFALMVNEVKNKYLKSWIQSATFLPHFISVVVAAGIAINVLDPDMGIVNVFLKKLGFEEIYFIMDPKYFRGIYTSMNIWRDTGFNALVYIAALAGVDQEMYEAGRIDGVNKLQEIMYITLPSIMPTIIIMLTLRIGKMLQVGFEAVLLLSQPATYETSDIISTYVYRTGILNQDYGVATAAGLMNSVVGVILVVGANRLSKKYSQSSLF